MVAGRLPESAEAVVRQMGENFTRMGARTLYAWILPYASAHEPLPALPRGVRRGEMKQCFENAFKVAAAQWTKRWKYAEGFAIGASGIIIHHAWALDEQERAVEVTWKQPGSSYFGIPIEVPTARSIIMKYGVWGLLPHGIKDLEADLGRE
jgi:hypothetical protein